MNVKVLSEKVGISPESVRYYTKEGLLHPRKDPANGYRVYSAHDVQRLAFVVRARWLGFSIKDIKELLNQADQGEAPCPTARALIEKRLQEVEQKIADLESLCKRMRAAMNEWQNQTECQSGEHICHLIEVFEMDLDKEQAVK